jgi:hypothetical protein
MSSRILITVVLLAFGLKSAFGQSCTLAKATAWYWQTIAHIKFLNATGVVADNAACHDAVNKSGDLARQIIGDSTITDVSKGISNCACDDFFEGDPRLRTIPPPSVRDPIPQGVFYVKGSVPTTNNGCWDKADGRSTELTFLNPCHFLGPQAVEIGHVGSSPWYYLMVSGACVNVDENRWNQTGEGVIHLLPCTQGARDNDQWGIVRKGDTWLVKFMNKRSGGCLDLRSQGQKIVQQNICNDLSNQWWKFPT